MPNDPRDYSKPLLPELHYGQIGTRAKVPHFEGDDEDINDDAGAAQWVIDVLGFDPKGI